MPSILNLDSAMQEIKRHITSRSMWIYEVIQVTIMNTLHFERYENNNEDGCK